MAPSILETERLRLREFRPADLDVLAAMVNDEEQMAFYPEVRTREQSEAWLERCLGHYRARGYGFWLMEAIATGGFAGYCGIRPLELDGADTTEIGWHVHRSCWNQGLATEAAAAVCRTAGERFGIERVVALIEPAHAASRRVAEKLGMRDGRTTVLDGRRYVVYETQVGWRRVCS